jgi:hypothetical protein
LLLSPIRKAFTPLQDLADGTWKVEIKMQCFSTIQAEVVITSNMPAGKWELTLLPPDRLRKLNTQVPLSPTALPIPNDPAAAKQPATPEKIPKPPDALSQQSSDGFLVNGNVNNAATSQYSLNQAFGNRRPNSKSLFSGKAVDAQGYESANGFDCGADWLLRQNQRIRSALCRKASVNEAPISQACPCDSERTRSRILRTTTL